MNPYEQSLATLFAAALTPANARAAARDIAALSAPNAADIAAILVVNGAPAGTAATLAGQVMNLPLPGAATPPAAPPATVPVPVVPVLGGPGAFALQAAWAGPLPTVGLLPGAGTPPAPPAPAPAPATTPTAWWKWLLGGLAALLLLMLLALGLTGLGLVVWRTWSAPAQMSAIAADVHAVATTLPGVATDVRRTAVASERTADGMDAVVVAMPSIVTDVRRTADATEGATAQLTATEAANAKRHQQVLGAIRALKRQPIEVKISGGAAPAAH